MSRCCGLSLLSCICAALISVGGDAAAECPYRDQNLAAIEKAIEHHIKRAADELSECNGIQAKTGNPSLVPYKRELDASGNVVGFFGITNSAGEITKWEPTDKDPNSGKLAATDEAECDFNEEAYKCILDALSSMRDEVDQIPCGKLITDINCSARPVVGNSVTYEADCVLSTMNAPVIQEGVLPRSGNGNSSLDGFYKALAGALKRRQQESSSETSRAAEEAVGVNSDQPEILAQLGKQLPSNMSAIQGESGVDIDGSSIVSTKSSDGSALVVHDDNHDDKPDWIAVEKPDGSSVLLVDSDGDLILDKRTDIDASGNPVYSDINEQTSTTTGQEPKIPSYGLTPDPSLSYNPKDYHLDSKSLELVGKEGSRINIADQLLNVDYEHLENSGQLIVKGFDGGTPVEIPLSKADVEEALSQGAGIFLIKGADSYSSTLQKVLESDSRSSSNTRIEGASIQVGTSLQAGELRGTTWDKYINDALSGEMSDFTLGDKSAISIYGFREPQSLWSAYGSSIVKGSGQDVPPDPYYSELNSKDYVPDVYWKNFQNPYGTNQFRAAALDAGVAVVGTTIDMYRYMQDDVSLVVVRTINDQTVTYRVFERYQDPNPKHPKWTDWYYVSPSRAAYVLYGLPGWDQ